MTAKKLPKQRNATTASGSKSVGGEAIFQIDPRRRTVVMTRIFHAPPQRVFDAWTRPEQVARWWGGAEGSRLSVCEVDLRPGGTWRFVERSSDGQEFPFTGIYREIDPPSRLVSSFIFDVAEWADRGAEVTTTFEAWKGKTKLTSTTVFRSVQDLNAFVKSGMEKGGNRSADRLAKYLAERS